MRRLIVAGLSAAVLFGVAACGGGQSTAEELGHTMVEAYKDRDVEALRDLACAKDEGKADRMTFEGIMGSAAEADFRVSFVKAVEDGDEGVVTLKLTANGQSGNADFAVLKEDGVWTICDR